MFIRLTECESTNDEAKQHASQGAEHGTVIVTEKQTAGRGRRGAVWHCPPELGLAFSVILRPNMPRALWHRLSLVTAWAVASTLQKIHVNASVKWPNDVWVHGKKICGILLESTADAVIVGIGINVNVKDFPEDISHLATSILLETGSEYPRDLLLENIVAALLHYSDSCEENFSEIIHSIRSSCALTDHIVSLTLQGEKIIGRVKTISDSGELILETQEKTLTIIQADEIRVM